MEVKALLRHTRTAPRKARLVANLIRGKNVNDAINILQFTRKRAAEIFQKLLKSAIANAEENHKVLDVEDLFVKNVRVDEGVTWKRNMPRARGTSTMIQKKNQPHHFGVGRKRILRREKWVKKFIPMGFVWDLIRHGFLIGTRVKTTLHSW